MKRHFDGTSRNVTRIRHASFIRGRPLSSEPIDIHGKSDMMPVGACNQYLTRILRVYSRTEQQPVIVPVLSRILGCVARKLKANVFHRKTEETNLNTSADSRILHRHFENINTLHKNKRICIFSSLLSAWKLDAISFSNPFCCSNCIFWKFYRGTIVVRKRETKTHFCSFSDFHAILWRKNNILIRYHWKWKQSVRLEDTNFLKIAYTRVGRVL